MLVILIIVAIVFVIFLFNALRLGKQEDVLMEKLFTIKEDDPEYLTAQRLLELLKCVLPIPSETVPQISILREFIGGSYFE